MALAQSPLGNTQKPEFKGLPLPEGADRHVLYQSSFRMVATYAMPLAELDNELRKVLNAKRVIVKVDDRHNFVGRIDCEIGGDGTLLHILMDTCGPGNANFTQIKYWIEF